MLDSVQRGGSWGCHCHTIFSWRWYGGTQDGRRWHANSRANTAERQEDSSPIQLPAACMNHTLLSSVLRFQSTPELLTQIPHILCCRAPCWLADVISGSGIISPARTAYCRAVRRRLFSLETVVQIWSGGWEFAFAALSTNHSFEWMRVRRKPGRTTGGSADPLWCSADDEVLPAQTPVSIQAVISSPHRITNKETCGNGSECSDGSFKSKD